jgi:hypothetical protein
MSTQRPVTGCPHGREGSAGTLPAMHAMGWIETMRPTGYVYAPSGPRLDPDRLVSEGAERWNHADELAWYLGLDPSVIVAEWARHLDRDVPMTVWRLQLSDLRVLDLRRTEVSGALFLPDDRAWVLDRERTRAVATMIRRALPVDALIVPSVAFLDRPEHGNLVVTLAEPGDVRDLIRDTRPLGRWVWDDDAAP